MTAGGSEETLPDWAEDARVLVGALMVLTEPEGWQKNPDAADAVRGLVLQMTRPVTKIRKHAEAEAKADNAAGKPRNAP